MTRHDRKKQEAGGSAADRAEATAARMFGWPEADGEAKPNGSAGFTVEDAPAESDDERVARLAKLPLLAYERARPTEAKEMGVRPAILDKLVATARGEAESATPGQGRKLEIARPQPWPEKVDGAEILDAISEFLARHVFLPPGAADALAAWTAHTYCFTAFRHSPRVAFTSPEKRCGKTTALDALGLLVCAPLYTANVTAAALFRTIEIAAPTILIDEADTFLRDAPDLTGALNAGHKRGGQVVRCVGEDAEPRQFSVFAPAALAAIGTLSRLGTIEDRSIVIRMRRTTQAERPAPLDARAEVAAKRLARMCARWARDHSERLAGAEPTLPATLFNRASDNWRCLFAIGQAAGSGWPARLAAAAAALAPDDDDEGRGVRLLRDIRDAFSARAIDRIGSADLCEALLTIESSPWADVNHGRPITPALLARRLRPFGIAPGTKRAGTETFKGYLSADFTEAFRRYLPDTPAEGAAKPSHRHNPQETANSRQSKPSHPGSRVTVCEAEKPQSGATCDGVTVSAPLWGEIAEPVMAEGEI